MSTSISDARMNGFRNIQALGEAWGSLYLFHPGLRLRMNRVDWEQRFLDILPEVERTRDPATLDAILKARLLPCLPDAPNLRRVHEGWNEDGVPYVYRQYVETPDGQPEPACAATPLTPPADRTYTRAQGIFGICKLWLILRYFAPHFPPGGCDADMMLRDWLASVEAVHTFQEYDTLLGRVAAQLPDRHAGVRFAAETMPDSDGRSTLSDGPQSSCGIPWLAGAQYVRALMDNIVYVTPFAMPDVATLKATFDLIHNTRGLILDLRGYPQTHFQHELARCLCQTPIQSPRYEIPVVREPDLRQRAWKLIRYTIQPAGRPVYAQPVVALIDEHTQSSAEDFCMYLKIAGRVTFVGRPTAGCVGNATYVNLPGGIRFAFTGMRVTWPDGSPMWGVGIRPDVCVEPPPLGRKVGHDEILAKGLEVLQTS